MLAGNSSRKGIKSIIEEGERWDLLEPLNRWERTQDTGGEAGLRENTDSRRQGGRGGEAKCWLISVMRLWKFSSSVFLALGQMGGWGGDIGGDDIGGDSVKCHWWERKNEWTEETQYDCQAAWDQHDIHGHKVRPIYFSYIFFSTTGARVKELKRWT